MALTEVNGAWYKHQATHPLTDVELEKHEDEQDEYDRCEAQVRELIYETVSKSVFLQIKGEQTAAGVWKKLTSISEKQGSLVATDTLTQLQLLRFNPEDDDNIESHTSKMAELHELLAEMGMPLTDEAYSSYIRTSLSHIPTFRNLFTSIDIVTETSNTTLPPSSLINRIHSQWRGDKVAERAEQLMEGTALVAKHWKGKGKGKQPDKKKKSCKNCRKKGHTSDECYAEGGGQADKASRISKGEQRRRKRSQRVKRQQALHQKKMVMHQTAVTVNTLP